MNNNVAEVLPLNINLNHGFYYNIPLPLREVVKVGKRVVIPFRKRKKIGIVLSIVRDTSFPELKDIEEVLDPIPILSSKILTLVNWMATYYLHPRGIVISQIIPSPISHKKILKIFPELFSGERIVQQGNPSFGQGRVSSDSKIKNYQYNLFPEKFAAITDSYHKPILFQYRTYKERDLYYISLIRETVQEGKQSLILIPDQFSGISLKKKLAKIWGKSFAMFDKKVSQFEKYLRFIMVQQDEIKVVLGTRSSIFLPFTKLGLIIVEQEDSPLYKEERVPHYHAREVALTRGTLESARVVLGSSTPAIESYWQGINKDFFLLTKESLLNSKYKKSFPILLVNLEEEKSFQRVISFPLQQKIAESLKAKKGVVLFLNRRGFARYISCVQCGQVMKCPNCNSLLSYQREEKAHFLVCPNCKIKTPYNGYCPTCGVKALKLMGLGTQYVEDIIQRMFPTAIIQRLDRDIAPNMRIEQLLLNRFNTGKINILIGTQLLTEKLNYQQVGLVAFILIDHLLNMPDYRSAEIAFQFIYRIILNLWEQKNPPSLLIQTCYPEHHSLQAVKELSYSYFYQREIMLRKELEYPPFTKIISIDFFGTSENLVKKSVQELNYYIHQSDMWATAGGDIFINDNSPLLVKERDQNRVSLLIRIKNDQQRWEQFRKKLFSYILNYQNNKVKLMVDVEPIKLY